MQNRHLTAVAAVVALAAAATANAADLTWTGGADAASWSQDDNWTPGFAPILGDNVAIGGGAAVNYDPAGEFRRGGNTTLDGNATLTLAGKRFLNADANPATFTLAGNAVLNQSGNYFLVGLNQNGTFNQIGGTVNSTVDRGFNVSDNLDTPSTYNLSGGTLNATLTGNGGDDNFNVRIGKGSGGDLFRVNGGTANFTATNDQNNTRVFVQRDATLRVDSGTADFNEFRFFSIGRANAGQAKVLLNGGALNVDLNANQALRAVIVGGSSGDGTATGLLQVSGGALNVTDGDLWLGDGSAGTVDLADGSILVDGYNVLLGRAAANSTSTFNMTGGTLTAADIVLGDATDSVFNFDGGLITLAGDRTSLLGESWFNAAAGTDAIYDPATNLTTIGVGVPEPTGLALLAAGGLLAARRRRCC